MNDINNCMLTGRLGRNPESHTFENGEVANFSLAVDGSYKDKSGERVERTTWVRVCAFGWMAGMVMDELSQGQKVTVSGALQSRRWTDKNGNDRETIELRAWSIHPGPMPKPKPGQGNGAQYKNQTKGSPYGGNERRDDIPF